MSRGPVIPEAWYTDLFEKADLEASYLAIDGLDHFYAEAMRGYLRSLQLRVEEAGDHFDRAQEQASRVVQDIPNLIRTFMLGTHIFDNALLQGIVPDASRVPDLWMPDVPEGVLDDFPEVRYVIFLRRTTEGLFRLYLGQSEVSGEIFRDLIRDDIGAPQDVLFSYYLGLAASCFNLGDRGEGERYLENAALSLQSGERPLYIAKGAGTIYGFCCYLGRLEEAEEWKAFLDRVECPEETKTAFLRRGVTMFDRSLEKAHLLLI